jgi:hypothetical protein
MELRGWELIVVLSLLVLILYHLCPRVTRPLAERKTWRRTYFVLGLGMDGCIADALWRTDPWLAGPGDSTPEDMLRFASDFMILCNTDYNLQWNKNYLQTEFYSILINLNEHNLQFVFHDSKLRFLTLKWTNNKEFDSLRSPLFNGDLQEESMANFMEFRNKLLDTVQFLVKHERLR